MNQFKGKTPTQLAFIIRDAKAALKCAEDLGDTRGQSKYADQIADASSELARLVAKAKADMDRRLQAAGKKRPAFTLEQHPSGEANRFILMVH